MDVIPTYQPHTVFDDVMTRQEQLRLKFLNEQGVDVHQFTLACPAQWEGEVDGYYLYYRSRGGGWSVDIGNDFTFTGKDDWFGWTPPHVSLAQIWQAVKAFHAWQGARE